MNGPCPVKTDLQALLDGSLSSSEQDELARHLDDCLACQETLQRLASGAGSWADIAEQLRGGIASMPVSPALASAIAAVPPPAYAAAEPTIRSEAETPRDGTSLGETAAGLPSTLGGYKIRGLLGSGGMGRVLEAYDVALRRPVAIKVMAEELATSPTGRARFLREARAAARVKHPHVVAVHAVAENELTPYLVMEFVAGESLQCRLEREGPLRLVDIVRIGLQTARGLAAAHAQGLVHRDIKPGNILLVRREDGRAQVKITDFGLARAADDASLTQSGVVAGTPMYMAPEQARGDAIDARADLFSLGSVLYVSCTGKPPFRPGPAIAILKRVCDDTPTPVRKLAPAIPEWLAAIVARLHAKDPAVRFQSATEVADLLERHLDHLENPESVPEPTPEPRRHSKRRPIVLGLSLLAACVCVGLTWFVAGRWIHNGAGEAWKSLFNGKDLAGWKTHPDQPGQWQVKDGILIGSGPPSHLFTERDDFEDFHLRVEARINSGGQACVYCRSPFEMELVESRFCPPGYGIRTDRSDAEGATVKLIGTFDPEGSVSKGNWIEPDRWFLLELIATGNRLVVKVDHSTVIDVVDQFRRYGKGHLALQQIAPGNVVEFRKVEIKEQSPTQPGETEESWTPLFNGKDLSGWKRHPEQSAEWSVEAGAIVGRGPPSHLFTERGDFENFHLRAEVKLNAGADSGILFRMTFPPAPDPAYEANIRFGNDANRTGSIWAQGEWLAPTIEDPVRPDEWFLMEVIADGSHIVTKVNGKTTADVVDGKSREPRGHLALQVWVVAPTVVHFRKIEIRELPATPPPTSSANGQPRTDDFILLANDTHGEQAFAGLAEAAAKAKPGDTIEVRGNGPYFVPPVDLGDRPMTIRAGANARPLLRLRPENEKASNLIRTTAGLTLEGLELQRRGYEKPYPADEVHALVRTEPSGSLRMSHCRLVVDGGACVVSLGPAELIHSEFFQGPEHFGAAVTAPHGLHMAYCIVAGAYGIACENALPGQAAPQVVLRHNTVLARVPLLFHPAMREGVGTVGKLLTVEATANVFQATTALVRFGPRPVSASLKLAPDLIESLLSLVGWKGQDNLYGTSGGLLEVADRWVARTPPQYKTLADWQRMWGAAEPGARLEHAPFIGERGAHEPRRFACSSAVWSAVFSPDGSRILSTEDNGRVTLRDVLSGAELQRLEHGKKVEAARFLADGRQILTCCYDGSLRLWDLESGQEVRRFEKVSALACVDLSPDGRQALSGSFDTVPRLWDMATGKQVRAFAGQQGIVLRAAFTPDGKRALWSIDARFEACVFDLEAGQPVHRLAHTKLVRGVAVAPNGKVGAVACADGKVHLWDLATGTKRGEFVGPAGWIEAVAFAPDGKSLLSGGRHGTRLWDVATGREVHCFTSENDNSDRPNGTLRSVAFSPDGRFALTAGADRTIRLWRIPQFLPRILADPTSGSASGFRLVSDGLASGRSVGADVDRVGPGAPYECWKQIPAYQAWLAAAVPSAARTRRPTPFIILARGDRPEAAFVTLADAIAAVRSGDTVEILGNGPFACEVIAAQSKALVIRAGEGYQPVLNFEAPKTRTPYLGLLSSFDAALVLEGLELHARFEPTSGKEGSLVRVARAPLHVANCRLLVDGPAYGLRSVWSPDVQVRNCIGLATAYPSVCFHAPSTGRLLMEGNLLARGGLKLLADKPDHDVSVQLNRNAWCTASAVAFHVEGPVALPDEKPGEPQRPFRIEADGNLFDCLHIVGFQGDPKSSPADAKASEALLNRLVAWRDGRNLYPARLFLRMIDGEQYRGLPTIADWHAYWSAPSSDSIQGQVRYQAGDLKDKIFRGEARFAPGLAALSGDDFRLHAESAGRGAARGGGDLGPEDLGLVGPGPAYVRWKRAPEYQAWLKTTGQTQ